MSTPKLNQFREILTDAAREVDATRRERDAARILYELRSKQVRLLEDVLRRMEQVGQLEVRRRIG